MQIQEAYHSFASQLFSSFNPENQFYHDLQKFLDKECHRKIQNTRKFIQALNQIQTNTINFNSFSTIIRMITKIVIKHKNQEIQNSFATFLIDSAKKYFPYHIVSSNASKFQLYLNLFKNLRVPEPKSYDQKSIIIYLSKNNFSEHFNNRLVQMINNEVLVDKKNQNFNSLKLNKFFGPFVITNFEKFYPQLERLLIRSETNIEIWEQFFTVLDSPQGMDPFVMAVVSKIKHLFINSSEISLKIVKNVTKNLSDLSIIKNYLQFNFNLISNEHNSKKKIIYIDMLKGIIHSIVKLNGDSIKQKNILLNDILVLLLNSLIKFTEEEEYNILVDIFDQILSHITIPSQEVAKVAKVYLKNQNKYILLLFGLTISSLYKKEHIETFPHVQQIFNHYKTQLNILLKKVEANWQWLLPIIYFMSHADLSFVDNLPEDSPLFKITCLGLSRIEKKNGLMLIANYIKYQKSEEEDISKIIYVTSVLLLEDLKQKQIWDAFLNQFDQQFILKLISQGIYPLTLFQCNDLKKNRGNNFNSLLLNLQKRIKNKIQVEQSSITRIIHSFYVNHVQLSPKKLPQSNEQIQETVKKYFNSSIYNEQSDEDSYINEQERRLIQSILNSLLNFSYQYSLKVFSKFIIADSYKKNLDFMIQFEKEVLNSLQSVKQQLSIQREFLIGKQMHRPEKVKEKKIYLSSNFEVKMMSQVEVKQQKYRKHFLKMLAIFDKISDKILSCLSIKGLLSQLWKQNFQSIMQITEFAEHRYSIYKLIKKSFQITSWENKKQVESKIFYKYSQFFASFFSLRHSGITPAVKSMQKCLQYLKQFLSLEIQNINNNFLMISNADDQFIMLFINEMCQYILDNMQFDINLKKLAIKFYYKMFKRSISFKNQQLLYTYLIKNINILASCDNIKDVLVYLLSAVSHHRYKQIFNDILNFIQTTKKLILQSIAQSSNKYQPEFQQFIKLKILALEQNPDISSLATKILSSEVEVKRSIVTFNMTNFVKKNSKETIEKLCYFIKESITHDTCNDVFKMVIKSSEQLFDQKFDQEGLQMLPFFLTINIEYINSSLFKPIFELLILKFTSKEQYQTLSKLSLEVGIQIIKKNAEKHAEELLLILQSFINRATGVSNIIFLGVLAPYLQGNKNLQIIQKRVTDLFKGNKESQQKSISKCIPDLMSFFKKPLQIVEDIFANISTMSDELQVGQSYLFSGLLKGIGYKETREYIDKIIKNDYPSKTKSEKSGRILLLNALVENFGRFIEIKSIKILQILIIYTADNVQTIRNLAKRVSQSLVVKMSSFAVKNLLPQLLTGLEHEDNWRIKISYIWILGIMANCSAKQLQTSLPIIVPTLSTCLSNAHPTIRDKASQALNLIGQTIKNPEISQCIDTLIQALENPFEKSARALEILLKTRFNHFIDPPSLSMIIPILDYCMRGRSSQLKQGSCQVIGSIVQLVQNSHDLLPYLKIIITGLKIALCDPLVEIRSIASIAIGRISAKIGPQEAELYFKFVVDIIESANSNTTERQGAAQAYAQIICSHDYDYFEESLNSIFNKLNEIKHSQKQGYILVFLYVPSIRRQQFQSFIKEVNENMYAFVSDEIENIRNSAMQVEKVLINNYCLSHTDLLLGPLCDGVFENNWKKRNSALILIGELLNIIKNHMYNTRTNDKAYAYYRGLMAVYIIKDDELQMPRLTANQVWNTYIENTPKTIKIGLVQLVKMWTRWTHEANGVVFKNIIAFSSKYGENYFTDILEYLGEYLKQPLHQIGVFQVLSQFIKRLNLQFLSKESYKVMIRQFFTDNIFTIGDKVREPLTKSLALYVQKMHEEQFFENLLYPTIEKMDETNQQNPEYTNNLHLLKYLLQTTSTKIVDRVINKIIKTPLSEFKIEVITNNADRLANHLYSLFKVPATQILVEEIYTLIGEKEKENRLNLIIYCLNQVSLKLNHKNRAEFIKMININIQKLVEKAIDGNYNDESNTVKTLTVFINMLLFFLNSVSLSEIQNLQILIGQLSYLLFTPNTKLSALTHKVYLLFISDIKDQNIITYYRQIIVSVENKITTENETIWKDRLIFKDYVISLVKAIAYGFSEVMDQGLDMLQFLLRYTERQLIEDQILRIVGPVIRILNYPLLQKQKTRIMELLSRLLIKKYKIEAFTYQILSVCLRILQQYKNSEEIIEVVSQMYKSLLLASNSKPQLIYTILSKIKHFGANLVQAFYLFVKSIINNKVELPKLVYEKIYEQSNTILIHNEGKLSVKAIYYASKISAKIGAFLNKPIQKLETQLSGLTCPFEIVLNYLHFAYYKNVKIGKLNVIQIFIKESSREKVYYLLKSLKLCIKVSEDVKQIYTQSYIKSLVPQNLSGFDQIVDILQQFEADEIPEQEMEEQIVQP